MWRKRVRLAVLFIFIVVSWPVFFPLPFLSTSKYQHVDVDQVEKAEGFLVSINGICTQVVQDSSLYTQGWDTLKQPNFWRYAMRFPPDTVIINIAKNRHLIEVESLARVRAWGEKRHKAYEDSIRKKYGLKKKDPIFFTTGRNHFYQFQKVMPEIDEAIDLFQDEGTDPWYAQTILLIESPGRMQFSTDGAYGAFQLMAGVAREVGLIVNDTLDEREEFDKSARGAARLINRVCLPHTRALCNSYGLEYEEHDLWFRLLTMHVYHAGIGNVRQVMRKIRPKEGGLELITELWQTKSRRFGNASQNYSQIALGALLEFDQLIQKEGIICPLNQMEDGRLVKGQIR
ncbi:MAG: hypothetical protein MRZ79_27680 [Bacteroidia bacterium]|nr:hypothetical protein [Bacteroidia bacterium]